MTFRFSGGAPATPYHRPPPTPYFIPLPQLDYCAIVKLPTNSSSAGSSGRALPRARM